jgi:parallel beta-helix repeat protein
VDQFGANVSSSGTVLNNSLTGAFGYGIAITSAQNFTVQGNLLVGNTSFIGSRGPNCSASDPTPASAAFIVEFANVTTSTLQSDFQSVQDAKGLTCVLPPDGGDYWPYGGNPTSSSAEDSAKHWSSGAKAALAISIIVAVVAIIVGIIFAWRWAVKRQFKNSASTARSVKGYSRLSS